MKTFCRLCFAVVLTAAFAMPALADGGITQTPGFAAPGETQGPPCADPGATQGPPCLDPGETHGPGFATELLLAIEGMWL